MLNTECHDNQCFLKNAVPLALASMIRNSETFKSWFLYWQCIIFLYFLSLVFSSLLMMCLGTDFLFFFYLMLSEFLEPVGICHVLGFYIIIYSNTLLVQCSSLFFWTLMPWTFDLLLLFCRSLGLLFCLFIVQIAQFLLILSSGSLTSSVISFLIFSLFGEF